MDIETIIEILKITKCQRGSIELLEHILSLYKKLCKKESYHVANKCIYGLHDRVHTLFTTDSIKTNYE